MSKKTKKKDQGVGGVGDLPPYHPKLMELFSEIEREFKILYDENMELKNQLKLYEEGLVPSDAADQEITRRDSMNFKATTGRLLSLRNPRPGPSLKTLYRSHWEILHEYSGHRDGVFEVTYNFSKGNYFGTASADRTARIWDLNSTICRYNYSGHKGAVNSIRFHPSEPLVCTSSGDKTCHVWRIPAVVTNFLDKASQKKEDSERGERKDETVKLKSEDRPQAEPSNLIGKSPLQRLASHTDVVVAACWLGKSRVVTGSWDQSVILWDIGEEKATPVQKLTGHEHKITNVEAHPREEMVISSSRDSTFRIWDFRKPSSAVNVSQGHSSQVTSAVFSMVGSYVVSASDDRSIKVWDLKYMKSPMAISRQGAGVGRIAISPIASTIAAPLDNGEIRLVDLSGGQIAQIPRSFPGHQKKVCSVAWSADESVLYSCGYTEQVLSWIPGSI